MVQGRARRTVQFLSIGFMAGMVSGCQDQTRVRDVKSDEAMTDITRTAFTPPPQVHGWPGLAAFDYDNDSDIDLFVANTTNLTNMFYQNDGEANFTFFARRAGLAFKDDGCVATGVGDFDNDGWLDLIISRQTSFFGTQAPNDSLLFMKNMGPGEDGIVYFEDVTDRTGLGDVTFATSIGVGDIDNDGLLDLYIGRYNLKDLAFDLISYHRDSPNVLLRSTGIVDGVPVFEDITESAGVAGTRVAGLAPNTADIQNRMPTWAVYFTDVNEDGLIDIFSLQEIPGGVDLFINNGDLTFTLTQEELLNKHGGWMGIAGADYNRDGHIDYFLANIGADAHGPNIRNHIANAWKLPNGTPFHRLLSHDGSGQLVDVISDTAVSAGVFPPTNILDGSGIAAYEFGFGSVWFDFQNDGWPDLHWIGEIVLSGLVPDGPLRKDFHGVGRFLANQGDGTFADETAERGLFNISPGDPLDFGYNNMGRALAAIDLNGDGFEDICRTNSFFVAEVEKGFACFLNPAIGDAHWITIRLSGTQSNRFGIGARVEVMADGTLFVGEVLTTTSAFTAVHPQVHFGLGDRDQIDSISVRWPSGIVTESTDVSVDQIITLNEE